MRPRECEAYERGRYDRRVVRGNTYAAVVQPEPDAAEAPWVFWGLEKEELKGDTPLGSLFGGLGCCDDPLEFPGAVNLNGEGSGWHKTPISDARQEAHSLNFLPRA